MCRKSKYGNCDEETKDDEYCIFHKPDKSEEEAREKIKVKDYLDREIEVDRFVFKGKVDCRGYVFPEIPDDVDFTFEYAVFGEDMWFRGLLLGWRGLRGLLLEKMRVLSGLLLKEL